MRPVPSNKLQQRLKHITNETLSPGTGTKHTAVGVIVEVYDSEMLRGIALERRLEKEIKENPGLLFAKVRLIDGVTYTLPFLEPEDQIYLTYGNGVLMQGRRCKVEWTGMNITGGHIILTRTHQEAQVSIPEVGRVLDIGNII